MNFASAAPGMVIGGKSLRPCLLRSGGAEVEEERGGWERHFSTCAEANAGTANNHTRAPFTVLLMNLPSNSFLLLDWQAEHEKIGFSTHLYIFSAFSWVAT